MWESSDHRSDSSIESDIESDGYYIQSSTYNASRSKSISDVEYEMSKMVPRKKILRKKKGQSRQNSMQVSLPLSSASVAIKKEDQSELHVKARLSPPTTSRNIAEMIETTSQKQNEDIEVDVVIGSTAEDEPKMQKGSP